MKYLILVGDGMGDHPLPELGNKTPLEAASTPAMGSSNCFDHSTLKLRVAEIETRTRLLLVFVKVRPHAPALEQLRTVFCCLACLFV